MRPAGGAAPTLLEDRATQPRFGRQALPSRGLDDADLVDDLRAINADFAGAFERQDFTAMGSANWLLHRRMLQAAGSAQLSRILEDHWASSARYRSGYQLISNRARHTIAEHDEIINAIAAGDAEAARAAARRHIQKAGADLAVIVARVGED